MIDCGHHHVVTNQAPISKKDTSLILKLASGIDKDRFADSDVFAKVCVKWWKQGETWINFLARQRRKYFSDLIRTMIGAIESSSQAHCLIAQAD